MKDEPQDIRWLSMMEATVYLGVRRETIYKWIKTLNLPAYRVGKLWKFKQEELDAWVRSGAGDLNRRPPGAEKE